MDGREGSRLVDFDVVSGTEFLLTSVVCSASSLLNVKSRFCLNSSSLWLRIFISDFDVTGSEVASSRLSSSTS